MENHLRLADRLGDMSQSLHELAFQVCRDATPESPRRPSGETARACNDYHRMVADAPRTRPHPRSIDAEQEKVADKTDPSTCVNQYRLRARAHAEVIPLVRAWLAEHAKPGTNYRQAAQGFAIELYIDRIAGLSDVEYRRAAVFAVQQAEPMHGGD